MQVRSHESLPLIVSGTNFPCATTLPSKEHDFCGGIVDVVIVAVAVAVDVA